ncbi:MFS transporter [Acidisphaera sp. L21]|uniref:MFS transporter n=1 Tax=Acidisphaera sp. L21 TaxID=1641851 RepID=UPI00131DCF82|nr:MFS transporter [Acidisphaera sp. L21]
MSQSAGLRVGLFTGAFFAAGAVSTAFLPLWMAGRHFDPAQIGALLGIASMVRLLAVPAWGAATDWVGRARPMLLVAAMAAAGAVACFPLAHDIGALLLLATLQGIAASALTPLTDTLTLALAAAGKLSYARTRAWGSAAYMLATAAAGPVLGWAGSWVVPGLVATGYAAAALLVPALPEPVRVSRPPLRLGGLLRLPALRLTILASALIQGSHAAYYGFAAIHWRAAGLGDTVIGLLIAEGIVMEIVLFVWGGKWVARLGPGRLTGLAAGACLVRWTALATTTALPILVVVQLLHAATFAMQHLSSMTMLGRHVPPGRAAGAQALHAALGFSAPTGLLIWLVGLGYHRFGGLCFLPMAALGGAGLLLAGPLSRVAGSGGARTA